MSFQQVNVHPDYLQRQLRLAAAIQQYFGQLLEQNQSRTRGLHRCLDRLTSAVARLQSARTVAALSAVQECHNELCVVEELLRSVDPRWTVENRQFMDRAKPAISAAAETSEFYFVPSSVRKSVCTLVRQLRGPHLSTCA